MPTKKQIIVGTVSALAVGSIAYAVYFDYKRRNDPEFRKQLKKQRKKAKKIRSVKTETKPKDEASLKIENQIEAIKKVINDEPIPTEMEAKETFFMQQLQKGEMLSYQGEPYYEVSALCYYRAFKVYPNPTELIVLLQRSTPEPVYKKIIEMISADVRKKQEEYFNLYPSKDMNVKIDKKDYDIIVTKDIAAGEIIYKEKPMMATLDPRVENTNYCSHCLKRFEGEGVRGKDKNIVFCSKECSEESWDKYNKYLYQPTLDDITEALKSGDAIEITNADPVGNEAPATIVAVAEEPKEEVEVKEEKPEAEAAETEAVEATEEKKEEQPEAEATEEKPEAEAAETEAVEVTEEKKEEQPEAESTEAKEEKPEAETTEAAEEKKEEKKEDVDEFWNLLKETKRTCPIMITRFVAKMIDRELNGKPQSEEYSEWDHLERFKFIDEIESGEDDEKELTLIQSIIGKHSNEILPKEYYNMLKGRFLYNIYAIPAPKEETSLVLEKSDEIKRYVAGETIIGAGLYHISSFIHNSLTPNVEVKFLDNNNVLSIVALRDLKEGEVITVKYINDEGKTPEEAKELLKKIYNIEDGVEKADDTKEEAAAAATEEESKEEAAATTEEAKEEN
ncbi:MAS20-domain-containing protein [Piromyces finnis]|uniref:MAS20-domain-containing protein n=1 Tax=Piromyces finnis TaxID=1754191 RepID=A0A1Y1UUU4_9FUNG|nr:MAS20-domain-containing protein [Piromyces finnis]|eukprot:ORX41808.1 MAS20-domain-containing protein [Piromyces finnis]